MYLEFYVDKLDLVLPEMLTENLKWNKVNTCHVLIKLNAD